MKKLTATSLALAITLSCGATSVMASALEDQDLAFAFGSESTMEVATLSEQEMKETEGALFWGGAAIGAVQYAGTNLYQSWDSSSVGNTFNNFKNNWSNTDFALSVGSGAVGGAYGNAMLKELGYTGVLNQLKAPLIYQAPIRANGAGLGFATVGVYKNTPQPTNNQSYSSNKSNWNQGPQPISTSYSSTYGNRPNQQGNNNYGAAPTWNRVAPNTLKW